MGDTARERQQTVVLGVTGCIAAYKACEVLRGLQKAGIRVKVVMTEHAMEFVGPATFKALTREPVATSLFDAPGDPIHHVSLAKEADLLLLCPATANVINKLAHGVADDLLTTTALACTAPIVVAPAMNVSMWEDDRTQESIAALKRTGARIVEPGEGHLACGDDAKGRLAEVGEIVSATLEELALHSNDLAGRRILITAGPTHEAIDPVRYITNRSSGKTGYAIAKKAVQRGAEVTLVSGPCGIEAPNGAMLVQVASAQEMFEACERAFDDADAAIFTAAVADFRPSEYSPQKIKKSAAGDSEEMTLRLVRNPDILKSLCARRAQKGGRRPFVVGYAAETQDILQNARDKLSRKGADLIVANDVSRDDMGFGSNDNKVWLVGDGGEEELPACSKAEIAAVLLDRVSAALREKA